MTMTEQIVATLARGAASGLAGTVVMTGFQRYVEMPITGRRESYAPADFAQRLGVKVRRRHRRRLNYAWRWSPRDWTIDAVDKLVLAEATGLIFDHVGGRPTPH